MKQYNNEGIKQLNNKNMKHITITLLIILSFSFSNNLDAQIYAPEGLNMPGAWDSWTNPPTNLVLAGESQTTGGQVMLMPNLSSIYQSYEHILRPF